MRNFSSIENAGTTDLRSNFNLPLSKASANESPLKTNSASLSKLGKKHRPNGLQPKLAKNKLLIHSDKFSFLPSVLKLCSTNSCQGSSLLAKRKIIIPQLSQSK